MTILLVLALYWVISNAEMIWSMQEGCNKFKLMHYFI